ncbi:hypothetical protein NOCARDAX2BIS_220109 [Nocardioides sp. AX2bis]|nr:hypothetical protein NOCARDAX2BIS_220109 [Nocardioides sp. AX2bis]
MDNTALPGLQACDAAAHPAGTSCRPPAAPGARVLRGPRRVRRPRIALVLRLPPPRARALTPGMEPVEHMF